MNSSSRQGDRAHRSPQPAPPRLEAFLLHFRNLRAFLCPSLQPKFSDDDVAASDYLGDQELVDAGDASILGRDKTRIYKMLAHISYSRTSYAERGEKGCDADRMESNLLAQLGRFFKMLPEERCHWFYAGGLAKFFADGVVVKAEFVSDGNPGGRDKHIFIGKGGCEFEIEHNRNNAGLAFHGYSVWLRRGNVRYAVGSGAEIVPGKYRQNVESAFRQEAPRAWKSSSEIMAEEYATWRTWKDFRSALGGVLLVGLLLGLLPLAVTLLVLASDDWARLFYLGAGISIGYYYHRHRMRLAGVDPDRATERIGTSFGPAR